MPITNRDRRRLAGPGVPLVADDVLVATDDEAVTRLRHAIERTAEHVRDRPATGLGHDDADDELGTIATDDAVGFDPLGMLQALDEAGVEVVVIGQVAGIFHGSRELTGDLDLMWDGDPMLAETIARVLNGLDAELFDEDRNAVPCDDAAFRRPKIQFHTANASGDFCTPRLSWGPLQVSDFIGRAEIATTATGNRISYLTKADLIAMRRAVGRPKDLRRAAELDQLD